MSSSNATTSSSWIPLNLDVGPDKRSAESAVDSRMRDRYQEEAMDSDQTLIQQIQQDGCPVAFEKIYDRHRDFILNVATRYCVETSDAVDVLQDTMIAFSRALPRLELRVQLTTFLYSITRNCAFKANRKRRRWRVWESVETFHFHGRGETAFTPLASSERDNGSADRIEQMLQIIPGLAAKFQEILWLRYRDELSLNEISERLEIPLGTVKSRLNTALNQIRRRL